jgi:hypothetical protein
MRLRPTSDWGKAVPGMIGGTSHIRYPGETMALRLTTSAPVGYIHEERWFRIEGGLHFFLGPDESFTGDLAASVEDMHRLTVGEWQTWVRGLAVPLEWQEAVIRSAITLKLCQHGESGAIVAALTTSIPEHHGSERNWDYRYCWVRDAYYTVQALNRLARSMCWKTIWSICATSSMRHAGAYPAALRHSGRSGPARARGARPARLSRHGTGARGQSGL